MNPRIYLDHAATSPLLTQVKEAMIPWLDGGNPSSLYEEGRKAKDAIDQAREVLSDTLGCLFAEVLFTSGGTEGANMAIIGAAIANQDRTRNRILVSAAEHHCVLHTKDTLEALGYRLELVPVDRCARINLDSLQEMAQPDVLLVSVMHANNELGTINPVREVAEVAHNCGALYHCDAVQTFGKAGLPQKVDDIGADLLTITAHKIGGPKGTGAIYLRGGTKLKPLIAGGGQEREMRGGTENTAGIVGFAEAIRQIPTDQTQARKQRDELLDGLIALGAVASVEDRDSMLATHAHVRFPGKQAETILIRLDRLGLSASSGAACSSGSIEPSHVLQACGYSEAESKEGLRFTFGLRPSNLEIATVVKVIEQGTR